jgi:hypothetical protein
MRARAPDAPNPSRGRHCDDTHTKLQRPAGAGTEAHVWRGKIETINNVK